jgi:hypothetical protein
LSGAGINLPVEVRARGRSGRGIVYDLLAEGCLIGCGPGLIAAGTVASLRFPSGMCLKGRATLLHGSVARIEFDQPLHEAVFAHLVDGEPGRQARRPIAPPSRAVPSQRAI